MLVIENNSVYEIDEECLKKKQVSNECGTAQKVEEWKKKKEGKKKDGCL